MTTPTIWIEEGCIGCGLCAHYCPQVFSLCEESRIRAEVREDGVFDGNLYRRSPLNPGIFAATEDDLAAVIADCPVKVVCCAAA